MRRRERGDEVQTFLPERPKEPFTDRVGLRSPGRRLQYAQAQVAYGLVQSLGEDTIAIVDQEAIGMI